MVIFVYRRNHLVLYFSTIFFQFFFQKLWLNILIQKLLNKIPLIEMVLKCSETNRCTIPLVVGSMLYEQKGCEKEIFFIYFKY